MSPEVQTNKNISSYQSYHIVQTKIFAHILSMKTLWKSTVVHGVESYAHGFCRVKIKM